MPNWLTSILPAFQQYGLPGLFVGVFLESFGLPVPGETMILLAAAMAGAGKLSVASVAATAFTAAALGDNLGYLIGRYGGRRLIVRHGHRFGITEARMRRVEAAIERRGVFVVAFARFVPLLRQLNGLAAGTAGMHWQRFLIANVVGAALWVGLWVTVAYNFGAQAHLFPSLAAHLNLIAAAVILTVAAAIAFHLLRRFHNRRTSK